MLLVNEYARDVHLFKLLIRIRVFCNPSVSLAQQKFYDISDMQIQIF